MFSFEYPKGKSYSGGVGQIVKQCRETLLDLGHDVYVFISPKFQKKHPVKLLLPDNSLTFYPNFWAFQKIYDLREFNFIIQHFVNWTKDLKKLKEGKGKKPKIIYHFHSILRREKDSGFRTFNKFLVNQERMIQIADNIICPSIYEYDNFNRYFPSFSNKTILIENTVETFPVDKNKIKEIKNQHGLRESDILSIYVGRLEKIKGAHILLREIPRILKKYKNHKIFIIGKALDKNLYRKLIYIKKKYPKQVFYIRYVNKQRMYQYYYLSHIYINTSLSESFSLSTHESAFCGNALLLNELPVFNKFKDAALFFSNCNRVENEFITKYEKLAKNEDLRIRLSRKACKIAKEFLRRNNLKEDISGVLKLQR